MRYLVQISPFLLALVLMAGASGCIQNDPGYPPTPVIKFKSYNVIGTEDNRQIDLTFEYTDGDGDIGFTQKDTFPPFNPGSEYYFNFIADYFEKVNGTFQQVRRGPLGDGDTVVYKGRIPNLTPPGKNKAIKGEITYTINPFDKPLKSNTIKFEIYIYDRALRKSNVIQSPEIVVN